MIIFRQRRQVIQLEIKYTNLISLVYRVTPVMQKLNLGNKSGSFALILP